MHIQQFGLGAKNVSPEQGKAALKAGRSTVDKEIKRTDA
jgi:hypothetical protein